MSDTQQLHQLQQIDSEIAAAQQRLKEIATSLVESASLKSTRQAYQVAARTYEQVHAKMTDLDLEVKGLQQKIAQNEKRLYSGTVVNPKEASSLQDEINSTKRWLGKREEDLIELMIEFEEQEATQAARKKAFEEARVAWEAEQADLLAEQAQLKARLKELAQARKSLAQFIVKDDLAEYERLRRKLGGVAVAVVDNDMCQACGVMVPSRLIQQAYSSDDLTYCENCTRILYVR